MSEDRQTRRHPQNLQGVLQLAVEAGSAAEGPAPPEPMSEEVRTCTLSRIRPDDHTNCWVSTL